MSIELSKEAHADAIRESVTANSTLLQEHIAQQSAFFAERTGDLAHANQQAIGQLAEQIHVQAMVMMSGARIAERSFISGPPVGAGCRDMPERIQCLQPPTACWWRSAPST